MCQGVKLVYPAQATVSNAQVLIIVLFAKMDILDRIVQLAIRLVKHVVDLQHVLHVEPTHT
jgi:hypothetical protein